MRDRNVSSAEKAGISVKNIVTVAVVAAVLAAALFGAYNLNGKSFDFTDREVRFIPTGSMDGEPTGYDIPTIPKDSLVVVKHLGENDFDSIRIGDVLTYDNGSIIVVHRVIAIDSATKTLTLKGDANGSSDPPVSYSQVTGKVVSVSHALGVVVNFVKTSPLLLIAGIVCAFIAVWALKEIIVILVKGDDEEEEKK